MTEATNGTSRRAFLGRTAGAAVAVAGASVGAGAIARSAGAATADTRGYTAGKFSLEIDGVDCGRLAGVDGGRLEANVVVEDQVQGELVQRKHIGGIKYEDLTIQVGAGMSKPMYDWIQSSLEKGPTPRHASIVSYDSNGNEKSRRAASQAFISEVTVPALDRTSNDPTYLAVKLTCPKIAPLPSKGSLFQSTAKQKAWMPSNFVFVVGGLDTSRVASVDSFTWKCGITADGSTLLEVSDIGVTFPRADVRSWQQWYDNMISGANDERDGALTLIGANRGAVATFTFRYLGGDRMWPLPGYRTRMQAGMYCEQVLFNPKEYK